MLAGGGAETKPLTSFCQDPASRGREPCASPPSTETQGQHSSRILDISLRPMRAIFRSVFSDALFFRDVLHARYLTSAFLLALALPRYQFTHHLLSLKHNLSPPSRSIHPSLVTKTSLVILSISGSSPYYHLPLVLVTFRYITSLSIHVVLLRPSLVTAR